MTPPLPQSVRRDRFRAAVVGLAVGDALGFPLRGAPAPAARRIPELAESFAPRPRGRFPRGQFSDDTQTMLAAAESAIHAGGLDGRALAEQLGWLWTEGVLLLPPASLSEVVQRLAGGAPWMAAGAPLGVVEPSGLSRALVVGLWDAGDPRRLPHDAGAFTVVTHKDPLCAAGAAAYARAVSLGLSGEGPLTPQAFCETVAAAARLHHAAFAEELRHLHRALAWEEDRALEALRTISVSPALLNHCDGIPPHVVPVLLTALYAVLKVPHDVRGALCLVLRAGGEVDVTAALTGGLLGAHLGTEAFPARLRKQVAWSSHLHEVADRLFDAAEGERSRARIPVLVGRRLR